jgi:hypothetical protein
LPRLARWYIKTALAWLLAGLATGVAIRIPALAIPASALQPVYIHFIVLGWLTQLIFGVAYWMFPKASLDRPRGHEGLAILSYALLNVGLLTRAVGEPLLAVAPGVGAGTMVVASAAMLWISVAAFVVNTWPRIR